MLSEEHATAILAAILYAGDQGPAYTEGIGVSLEDCVERARRLLDIASGTFNPSSPNFREQATAYAMPNSSLREELNDRLGR